MKRIFKLNSFYRGMNFEIPIDGDNKEKEEKKKESYDNDSNKNLKRGLTSSWGRGGNNTSKIIEQRRAPCWKKFTWFEFRVNSRNRTSRREEGNLEEFVNKTGRSPVWKRARRRGTIRTNRKLPKDHPFIPRKPLSAIPFYPFFLFIYLFISLLLLLLSRFFPPLLLPPASLFAIRT